MFNLKLSDFDFNLPAHLIAQQPLPKRSASRLLKIDLHSQQIAHHHFRDLLTWLQPEDILIFNDTKVIKARLFGHKSSGGKIECLIERILSGQEALAHIRASKSPPIGSYIFLAN